MTPTPSTTPAGLPPVRTVFMGTADLAAVCFRALVACQTTRVLAAISQPDRPKGRSLLLQPTPVKAAAIELEIPVLQPLKARDPAFLDQLRALQPDLIVVAAYGQILPRALLDIPRHGCLNVHTSLLPQYRGAAPIQWAILNGDTHTGVTIMKIDEGLDTGDILSTRRTPIGPDENAQQLHDRLAALGAELLLETVPLYLQGTCVPRPQPPEGASHARKIVKDDGRLDWTLPAATLANRVRGLVPWPGAFTTVPAQPHPLLLKIWEAQLAPDTGPPGTVLSANAEGILVAAGTGSLRLLTVQREGGRRMSVKDFLPGCPIAPGTKL